MCTKTGLLATMVLVVTLVLKPDVSTADGEQHSISPEGEYFVPNLCKEPFEGRFAARLGDTVFDVPVEHFGKYIPPEIVINDDDRKPHDPTLLCPENPVEAVFLIAVAEWRDETYRFVIKQAAPPDRIERRRAMLARMREAIDCQPMREFVKCDVLEGQRQDKVSYFLSRNGPDPLPSGQTFHLRCTIDDGRCAIYDEISVTHRVEFGREGIDLSLGVEGHSELIGHLATLAKGWMREG